MGEFRGVTGRIYDEVIRSSTHLLIAGATGSGKSTIEQGFINSLLYQNPAPALMLIDPKAVDLWKFASLRNCVDYADDVTGAKRILFRAVELMEQRFKRARSAGLEVSNERPIYIIIDELADLVLTDKTIFAPLQRLLSKARAANIRIWVSTQIVNRDVLPTLLRGNIGTIISLRCETPTASRLLIGKPYAEELPRHGEAYIKDADGLRREKFPMIPAEALAGIVEYWKR